jgi:hypothetical protein
VNFDGLRRDLPEQATEKAVMTTTPSVRAFENVGIETLRIITCAGERRVDASTRTPHCLIFSRLPHAAFVLDPCGTLLL